MKNKWRIIILDLGHPMSTRTIRNIINSLENILALIFIFSASNDLNLGVSVLNFDVFYFQSKSDLSEQYSLLVKYLNELKTTKERVTVSEYKKLLRSSFSKILSKFSNLSAIVEFIILSKKTASILSYITTSLISSLKKCDTLQINHKIIQILDEESEKTKLINSNECLFCVDNVQDLDLMFKGCLLKGDGRVIQILFPNDELEIKCDVEDCVVNPFLFDFGKKVGICQSDVFQDNLEKVKIINRIPVAGLCPTFVFGTPRRLLPFSDNPDSQENIKMFRELCKNLSKTGQGLLVKSVASGFSLQFLTSDGVVLLMNDVATNELHIPKPIDTDLPEEDDAVTLVVETNFSKIKLLEEYNPENFTGGLYDPLKQMLEKAKAVKLAKVYEDNGKTRKKRLLENLKDTKKTHPALLSSDLIQKYRKIHSHAFNLLELTEDFDEK